MTEKIILQTLYYSNNGFEQKPFNNDKTIGQIFLGTGYLQRFKVCPYIYKKRKSTSTMKKWMTPF